MKSRAIPHDLNAEKIVFLPDTCLTVSDCGCGMRLLRSELSAVELDIERWDRVADHLRSNKGGLGDLGGGNHFLDALEPYDDGPLHFLINTGSRNESGHVDTFVDTPDKFDGGFNRVVACAADNRSAIHDAVENVFGSVHLVVDLPRNTYQILDDASALIRKGSVRVSPGGMSILPSHMSGDVVLVPATDRVDEILNSISHGTGRKMSRSDFKPLELTLFHIVHFHPRTPPFVVCGSVSGRGRGTKSQKANSLSTARPETDRAVPIEARTYFKTSFVVDKK